MGKINQDTAQSIIDDYISGLSSYELSSKYNLWQTSICNIISGRSWSKCNRPCNIREIIKSRKDKGLKIGRSHKDLPILSSLQEDVLVGSMLGDGYLTKAEKFNSKFCKKQHHSKKEYLNWHFTSLRQYSANIKEIYSKEVLSQGLNGKIRRNACDAYLSSYEYTTYSHPNLTILRDKWYVSNKKTIPNDLLLNPLRIAVWYFDDGCNSKKTDV